VRESTLTSGRGEEKEREMGKQKGGFFQRKTRPRETNLLIGDMLRKKRLHAEEKRERRCSDYKAQNRSGEEEGGSIQSERGGDLRVSEKRDKGKKGGFENIRGALKSLDRGTKLKDKNSSPNITRPRVRSELTPFKGGGR